MIKMELACLKISLCFINFLFFIISFFTALMLKVFFWFYSACSWHLLLQESLKSPFKLLGKEQTSGGAILSSNAQRKTKIVCTIGPSTSSREMIWKLAEAGMNVARLNMSHGDHASHQKTIDLVKEYNSQFEDKVIAIMLDTKVIDCLPFDILPFHNA